MSQFIPALGLLLFSAVGLLGLRVRQDTAIQNSSVNRLPGTPGELLHAAVRGGDIQQLQRLLASGVDANARDALGNPALFEAAWIGNTELASVLLGHGADVNARNDDTASTALWYAVQADHVRVVNLLVARGARLDLRYASLQTILHLACARGNPQIVKSLLAAHADVAATDQAANTALDEAVLNDRLEVLRLLLSAGADVKRVHPLNGRGPVQEACVKGFANLIAPLVDAGADPLARDRYGLSPLDLALAYKNENVIRALLYQTRSAPSLESQAESAMQSATFHGQTVIAKLLIDSGFDIRRPTHSGSTYLNDAALKGYLTLVQLFLDSGADIESRNATGGTPLHDAALGGNVAVIAFLLDRGARINAIDRDASVTPLMLAASMGHAKAVETLLEHGADRNLKDRFGRTALDRARETADSRTVELLEKAGRKGAPVLAPPEDGS